jgi:hypothetical protein
VQLNLRVLDGQLAICRLEAHAETPTWATSSSLCSVTWTAEETSVVCLESAVPKGVQCERGWRAVMLVGPFEFSLTGVLRAVLGPLADAGVSIFAVSTFDTDYVLVKQSALEAARVALEAAGHRFV